MKAIIIAAFAIATATTVNTTEAPSTGKEATSGLDVAVINNEGSIKRPDNLDRWIFMGQTIGMTYFDEEPDPEDIGYSSSVLMEPNAYEIFLKTGEFPEGTLFAKIVRETLKEGGGYFMGKEVALEIHLKDKERFPKNGFNFWFFSPNEDFATALPADNVCVTCHKETAAYDNFFTQYYPTIRHKIPKK